MNKAQMANVKGAAIMHNGEWLKISDRDEVNDLKGQITSLDNQVSNMNTNVWLECTAYGIDRGKFLFNPYQNHLTGTGIIDSGGGFSRHEYNDYIFNFIKVFPPSGYYFDGNTETYSAIGNDSEFRMTQRDGYLILRSTYASTGAGKTLAIDSFVRGYKY